MRLKDARHLTRALSILAGCLVATGAGIACLHYSFADPLTRASYDLPFLWRSDLETHEIVLVYLDEQSAAQLHQALDDKWNRLLHVQLLERLAKEQAKLAFYDIVFDTPDANGDTAFADAIQKFGKGVLGAALDIVQPMNGVEEERVVPPLKLLRKAAAGWGILAFKPVDADYGVRRLFPGTNNIPTATWKAAAILDAPATHEPRESVVPRWINYYGRAGTFSSVNFARALEVDGLPAGYFKDKIVMIGGRSTVGYLAKGQDEFGTPYSRGANRFTTGLEVHANILLNLLRHDWLTRLSDRWETGLVIVFGILAGLLGIGPAFRPAIVISLTVLACLATAGFACWMVWHKNLWFNWLVPAAVEMPLGLTWTVISQYLLESRKRKELRRAFGFYLSPEMADRISNSDFDLKPGGKMVDATVIFTDLENFTTLSEHLDPQETSEILTSYFGQTTKCILENKGTIIKYVGDAVFAAWGAPIDEPEHARYAVETACVLRSLSELEIHGKRLRTRIGIHSGRVLAGNLGSAYRFDYTMIGDAVNFASRLESLNKYLSTQVLISDAVRQQIGDGFITRLLGEFIVAGKTNSVVIHELLCRCDAQNEEKEWIETFELGLTAFREADFDRARQLLDQTKAIKGGGDGPSEFYLRKLEGLVLNGKDPNWTGVVELSSK